MGRDINGDCYAYFPQFNNTGIRIYKYKYHDCPELQNNTTSDNIPSQTVEVDEKKSKLELKYEKVVKKYRRMTEKINRAKKIAASKSAGKVKNRKVPQKNGRKRKNEET